MQGNTGLLELMKTAGREVLVGGTVLRTFGPDGETGSVYFTVKRDALFLFHKERGCGHDFADGTEAFLQWVAYRIPLGWREKTLFLPAASMTLEPNDLKGQHTIRCGKCVLVFSSEGLCSFIEGMRELAQSRQAQAA